MRERETHQGIQGVDLTTAMHLFTPQDTFALANDLNKGKPQDQWAQIEIYPTVGRVWLEPIRLATNAIGLQLPMTPSVTEADVRKWQKEYPHTKVARVHLPFSYDLAELWHRPFFGENTLRERAYQIAWILYFGAATNERGIKMAQELSQDSEVGVNAHTNVLEGLVRDGRLEEIKQRVSFVLAENERKYNSPVVKDQRVIYDPVTIARDIVEKYGLRGMIIGVDHGIREGVDIQQALKDKGLRQHTTAMHLAKTIPGIDAHDAIAVGDEYFGKILQEIARTSFGNSVRAALDYNPSTMKGKSGQEQVRLVRNTIDWIMSTQREN